MKKCSICGRETNATYNLYGYKNVCSKHMHQILKYGKPLDDNPRTNKDLNDYRIEDNIAIFKVYSNDQKNKMNFVPKSQGVVKKAPEKIDRLKYHNKHMQEGDKRNKIADK